MGAVNDIALHPDHKQMISVGQEKKISYWDLRQPTPLSMVDVGKPSNEQLCIAMNREGTMFATAGVDYKVSDSLPVPHSPLKWSAWTTGSPVAVQGYVSSV